MYKILTYVNNDFLLRYQTSLLRFNIEENSHSSSRLRRN